MYLSRHVSLSMQCSPLYFIVTPLIVSLLEVPLLFKVIKFRPEFFEAFQLSSLYRHTRLTAKAFQANFGVTITRCLFGKM